MKAINLKAEKREVFGKKVKKLRKGGMIPATVYGKDIKSASIAVSEKEFLAVYRKAGETGLVELAYEGKSIPTLISNVQIHAVLRNPLHAEFHAVKLTDKIKANVPVVLTGESPAVANSVGVLLQTLNEIEVEALPTELPEKIEVDVTTLSEIGQQVTVADLKVASEVAVLTPSEEIVVKVAPAVSEETAKELAAEEAAKTAEAAATTEGEATAAAPEAETPESSEEKK